MTEARIQELKELFGARRRALERDLETKLRDARASTDAGRESRGLDAADASNADLQQDVELALLEMRSEMLRRIDDAVARLASGAYGYCSECGGEIAPKRLEALPFAVRCRDCEDAHEMAQRHRHLAQRRLESLWIGGTAHD